MTGSLQCCKPIYAFCNFIIDMQVINPATYFRLSSYIVVPYIALFFVFLIGASFFPLDISWIPPYPTSLDFITIFYFSYENILKHEIFELQRLETFQT